jgi:hypothetical protein
VPRRLVLLALAALAVACAPADPQQVAAERFIDRLFVEIDQRAARELTAGLATAKIDEEIRLTTGQAIDESTQKPRVHYRFVQRSEREDATASLVYELDVSPDGTDAFTRRLILTLRREGDAWKVSNYTLESPPEAG